MTIADNLLTIGQKIKNAEQHYHKSVDRVRLLAVSKRHPASAIQEATTAGQLSFGENYVQEMANKAAELNNSAIEWHFIGPIQSNKTRQIASIAQWVHSVDRYKIAHRLNEQRLDELVPLNICLQVNISGESSKSGVTADELPELAENIAKLPNLKLRGLMAIPAPETDFAKQRDTFAKVRKLQEQLIAQGLELDTLSMGMTGDMEAAIAEGSTLVRIGTAIFGHRPV